MATPLKNSVPITDLGFAGLSVELKSLIDGAKWGAGGYGTGVTLTYSFPWTNGQTAHAAPIYGGNEWAASFDLNANEQSAVTRVLRDVSRGANVRFNLVADNSSVVGELRFTGSHNMDGEYAYAYLPTRNYPDSGDVWFSTGWLLPGGGPIREGTYEYMTILHEVGHALGLKHPFEQGASGEVMPAEYDHYAWTAMSYFVHESAGEDIWASFYPTTLMYLDLLALEKLYGPSLNANTGNTTYTFREGETYWETISDSGGIDTIRYVSSSHGGYIDLSNATFSRMGRPVRFDDGESTRQTIGLGPSTLIENATGGEGSDRLIGNHANNQLTGRGGDDVLIGAAGRDVLDGGQGADRLVAGGGNDVLVWQASDIRVDGGEGGDVMRVKSPTLDAAKVGTEIVSIERIDMTGIGTRLYLAGADVLDISGMDDTLAVLGDAGDVVVLRGAFDLVSTAGGFETWRLGAATVKIEVELDVV